MKRKLELMHALFGVGEGSCGECSHFVSGRYRSRTLRKCKVYGLTHSEASDWAKKWQACGLKDKYTNQRNIIRLVRRDKTDIPEELDGQIEMVVTE